VGIYPAGASFYGCLDMAGNVWEWTSTLFRDYPYRADDGRENPEAEGRRVLRGGSWRYDQRGARCSSRPGYHPADFSVNFGFRVVSVFFAFFF